MKGISTDLATTKKGLDKVIMRSAESITDYVSMLYKPENFSQLSKTSKVYSGLTEANTWDGESIITPEGIEYLFDITAVHALFSKAYSITYNQQIYDEYAFNPKVAQELGQALGERRQKNAASLFNNGFSTDLYADGVYFFSASHPNAASVGGVQSNLVTGGVSLTVLNNMVNLLLNLRSPLSRPVKYLPAEWLVHPTKVMLANQIVKSIREYGTANNTRNQFDDFNIKVVGYPWFSSTTMHILRADKFETKVSKKVGFQTEWKELDDKSLKHQGWFGDAFWADDWRGWVGSTGL
jgi:hypothetical protein